MSTRAGSAPLPSPEDLARLVSKVTEQMCSLPFSLAAPEASAALEALRAPTARASKIWIEGPRALAVAIVLDLKSAKTAASAAFALPAEEVDGDMIDDLLREFVNIIAGQINILLKLDHSLGLPSAVEPREILDPSQWHGTLLQNEGESLILWVAVGATSPGGSPERDCKRG